MRKVTVIVEPDAYSFNLVNKKGTHAIDQGGTGDLHLPIVLAFDPKHKLGALDRLEFGDELSFFEEAGATKKSGPAISGKGTDAYTLKTPAAEAILLVEAGSQTPLSISWESREGKYKYDYQSYVELPFDVSKFSKPAGITFREMPPDTTGER